MIESPKRSREGDGGICALSVVLKRTARCTRAVNELRTSLTVGWCAAVADAVGACVGWRDAVVLPVESSSSASSGSMPWTIAGNVNGGSDGGSGGWGGAAVMSVESRRGSVCALVIRVDVAACEEAAGAVGGSGAVLLEVAGGWPCGSGCADADIILNKFNKPIGEEPIVLWMVVLNGLDTTGIQMNRITD